MRNAYYAQRAPYLEGELGSKRLSMGLIVLLCICLVSCVRPEPDRSYLEGIPCSVPCWQGITPGVSDEATVQAVISSLDLVEQDSISRHVGFTRVSGAVSYIFEGVSGERYNVNLYDGFVYEIRLGAPGLSLEEVLNVFGSPDSAYATRRPNQHTIYDYYEVLFFYPDLGLYIGTSECAEECDATLFSGDDVYISSEMATWQLSFFEPGADLQTVLRVAVADVGRCRQDCRWCCSLDGGRPLLPCSPVGGHPVVG